MSAEKNVPAIRFEGFDEKLEERKLSDVVEFIGTGKSVFDASNKKTDSTSGICDKCMLDTIIVDTIIDIIPITN